jgi:hypothetical protein
MLLYGGALNCSDIIDDKLTNENGALVEWYWQEKTELLGEKSVPMPLCPQ